MSNTPRQLSNAKVSVFSLNSSGPIEALAVVALDSTGGIGTPGAGSTQVSVKEILTSSGASVMDSTEGAIKVNVVAGAAGGSTIVTISTGSVRVHQSTAADLNAAVVQGSTVWQAQVSSLAGLVTVSPISSSGVSLSTDASPASTKQGLIVRQVGNTYDSSGALQVNTGPGGSTQVAVSSGIVQVQPISSSGVSMSTDTDPASTKQGLIVRQVGFSTIVAVSSLAGVVSAQQNSTVWAVQIDGRVRAQNSTIGDLLASVQQNSTVWQTQTKIQDILTSSGGSVMDSTEVAIKVNVVAGAAGGSTTVTVRQSTAADLNVTVAGYVAPSTTVNVSSLAGAVIVRSSAADALMTVYQSTMGALLAQVAQNSTVWQTQAKIQDSSAVTFVGSTSRPSTGVQGLVVRHVLNDLQSTAFSTMGNNSTSSTIVSSAAAIRHKVYAYSITSTVQAVNTLSFASSLGNPIWQIQLQSISSGIAGANLAVSPPAWLFATEAASPLVFKVTGTTGTYHLSFSYFSEA